jgi:hypothetical protein
MNLPATPDPLDLDQIKARRAAMPAESLEIDKENAEEYYGDWFRIRLDIPPDQYGHRPSVALTWQYDEDDEVRGGRGIAEFIAHAPGDIDRLIAEVEQLRGQVERLEGMFADCRKHRDRAERNEGRLLARLDWIRELIGVEDEGP